MQRRRLGVDGRRIRCGHRFVKNGASPLDGLCAFACEGGGFRHSNEQMESDGMATEQGFYALAAYDRFRQGQTRLFDMTDIEVK